MKRLLIIDQQNIFIRSYITDPSLSRNGEPIGGVQGALKSLQKFCRETKPNEIVICWDGQGGSQKKRLIDKNYKSGRVPLRLNRFAYNLNKTEELENKIWQMTRLSEYYDQLPVKQFMFDSVEADDVISYVCLSDRHKNYQKIIVSSDKDFIQLLDKNTILYRPTQGEILNKDRVIKQYGISPQNFVIARSMCGGADKSDNIKGVRGVGMKKVVKYFPFLSEEKTYILEELVNFCEKTLLIKEDKKEKKINKNFFEKIIQNEELILKNFKLMQLDIPNMSIQNKQAVNYILENEELVYCKNAFMKMMIKDGFGQWTWDDLSQACNRILSEQ